VVVVGGGGGGYLNDFLYCNDVTTVFESNWLAGS
jgi:hypothetical protein